MLPTDEKIEMVAAAIYECNPENGAWLDGAPVDSPLWEDYREHARAAIDAAFAAPDDLVDQAADALASTGLEHALRERAEVVLRAVGLLP